MSRNAVTLRLRQAAQLRRACLTLAKSSKGIEIRRDNLANKTVQRTSLALEGKMIRLTEGHELIATDVLSAYAESIVS